MLRSEPAEQGSSTVRYVSGLGALPGYVHGFVPELLAAIAFVALMLWIFWLWTP
jgi:hypothetical protein